ncbi:hypothetical protein [Novosphingobium guangzhouense]|uniref:Uncharacterized protein n=1 Tax=Novosphingobium guangzhouense TaxID=1850347 RepID=A0A2K2FV59_9SPHN|nr:hypothetical protein [Novosphingobium guangzhouense]PNU02666.1 hypothetical protein A8V01_26045 [Novosphingobium guangzhouense]
MKAGAYGWQTSLADLSLILFMLAAAALHDRPEAPQASGHRASPQSEPLAVYHPAPDAPRLDEWLGQQAVDPRQQLTITVNYGPEPGARAAAMQEAARLLAEAGLAGRAARIVVEPGIGPARAALAYDTPNGTGLAP